MESPNLNDASRKDGWQELRAHNTRSIQGALFSTKDGICYTTPSKGDRNVTPAKF